MKEYTQSVCTQHRESVAQKTGFREKPRVTKNIDFRQSGQGE